MDLVHALRTNGSVRAFEPDPVDDATLHRILDTARFAPNGGNKQGWHVVVVKDAATRTRVQELAQSGWNEYAAQAQAGRRPFAADESGRWPGPGPVDLAGVAAALPRALPRPHWETPRTLRSDQILRTFTIDHVGSFLRRDITKHRQMLTPCVR